MKLVAALLSLIISASAVTVVLQNSVPAESLDDLRAEFTVDTVSSDLDYAYWAPEAEDLSEKCPLVVYIHGRLHGWTSTSYLEDNYMPYWITDEMQSGFSEGGAHILLVRIPETLPTVFRIEQINSTIMDYVNDNPEIDRNKILLIGSSAGGGAVWKLLTKYPGKFASAVICCSTVVPSKTDIAKAGNTPIWLVSAKKDELINYTLNQKVAWNNLKAASKVPSQCRQTLFNDKVVFCDGEKALLHHSLANTLGFGLLDFYGSPLPDTVTTNGKGAAVTNNGIVAWFEDIVN